MMLRLLPWIRRTARPLRVLPSALRAPVRSLRERGLFLWISALALACLSACAATASEMRRAEDAYEQARFDAARTWLVDLEDRAPSMDEAMRARYFYLRGMAEYRLGHRQEALHYLEVAHELVGEQGRPLREEQRELLTRTLAELEPREPLSHRPPPADAE